MIKMLTFLREMLRPVNIHGRKGKMYAANEKEEETLDENRK